MFPLTCLWGDDSSLLLEPVNPCLCSLLSDHPEHDKEYGANMTVEFVIELTSLLSVSPHPTNYML